MKNIKKEGYIAAFSFVVIGALILVVAFNQGISTLQGESLLIIGSLVEILGIVGMVKPGVAETLLHYLKTLAQSHTNNQSQKQIQANPSHSPQIMTGQGDIHVHNTPIELPTQSSTVIPNYPRIKKRLEDIKGEASQLEKSSYEAGEVPLDKLKKETKQIIRMLHPQDADSIIRNMFPTLAVYSLSSLQDKEGRQAEFMGDVSELTAATDILINEIGWLKQ